MGYGGRESPSGLVSWSSSCKYIHKNTYLCTNSTKWARCMTSRFLYCILVLVWELAHMLTSSKNFHPFHFVKRKLVFDDVLVGSFIWYLKTRGNVLKLSKLDSVHFYVFVTVRWLTLSVKIFWLPNTRRIILIIVNKLNFLRSTILTSQLLCLRFVFHLHTVSFYVFVSEKHDILL